MPRCASHFQISQLIYQVFQDSGLKRSHFIQNLGYRNITGGLRSLDRWLDDGEGDSLLIERLARVYGIDDAAVRIALVETEAQHYAEHEQACRRREAWERQNFRQYVFVETRPGSVQSSFTVAGIVAPALKTVRLPENLITEPESTQMEYVTELVRAHFHDRTGTLTLFGEIVGYRFVGSYDDSIRFDTAGNVIERVAGHFIRPGGSIQIGRKTVSPALLLSIWEDSVER